MMNNKIDNRGIDWAFFLTNLKIKIKKKKLEIEVHLRTMKYLAVLLAISSSFLSSY